MPTVQIDAVLPWCWSDRWITASDRVNMDPQSPPRVSFVIDGRESNLDVDDLIESALAQTFDDIEILIIVAANSVRPAHGTFVTERQRKIRLVEVAAGGGRAAALNQGVANVRGLYTCILGPGDRPLPRFLERGVAVLDADDSVAFVSCRVQIGPATASSSVLEPSCGLPGLLLHGSVGVPSLVRTSVRREVGGYDEMMPTHGYEEWDLWIAFAARGYQGAILNDVLCSNVATADSRMNPHGEVPGDVLRYIMHKHADLFRTHLFDLLVAREAVSCQLQKENYEIEYEIEGELKATVARLRGELAQLTAVIERNGPRDFEPSRATDADRSQFDRDSE